MKYPRFLVAQLGGDAVEDVSDLGLWKVFTEPMRVRDVAIGDFFL